MIYDRLIEIFTPDAAAAAIQRKLTLHSRHYCAPMTVYHSTHFSSAQAGQTVDMMVQLPLHHRDIDATMFAVPPDGHTYKIVEAQPTWDDDGLPVTVLSLHREEAKYDLLRP